jgi:hypothetical protein
VGGDVADHGFQVRTFGVEGGVGVVFGDAPHAAVLVPEGERSITLGDGAHELHRQAARQPRISEGLETCCKHAFTCADDDTVAHFGTPPRHSTWLGHTITAIYGDDGLLNGW